MCEEPMSVDLDGPREAEPQRDQVRRNYTLGVLSGAAGTLTFDFLHPELILAGMVYALTESKLLVALVTVVSKAGVLAPQLLVGHRLEHRPLKRPYYLALSGVKIVALAAMIAAMAQLSSERCSLPMLLFFLAYLVACICNGASHVVFMDMAGRMIPSGRVGAYFGTRHLLGGVFSIALGALVIQPVLTHVALPLNYLVLAVIGAGLALLSATLFALCREQAGPTARAPTTLGESLRRGMGWLRSDRDYRSYFWQRIGFRITYLGLAFFIPYGSETLSGAGSAVGMAALGGIMVATIKLSRTLASALWGRAADRRGYRSCLVGAGVLAVGAPALALAAPCLPRVFAVALPLVRTELDLPLLVYMLALVVMGVSLQGTVIGGARFLVTTAPAHRRISYVGFLNTVTSPLTLLPLAGAWLAEAVGIRALFAIVTVGGLIHLLAAARMSPGPPRRRPAAEPPEESGSSGGVFG